MRLSEFLVEDSTVVEGDERHVASSAYKVNYANVVAEIAKLQRYLEQHKAEYENTNMLDWGYSGDLAHVAEQLSQINEFLSEDNRS